jgi:hypothetical protein
MQLVITLSGVVQCVYDEQIDVRVLGSPEIRRASHVEPTPDGRWTADLSPVDGPTLGPFVLRSDALAAEKQWLEEQWLGRFDAESA